jgi:ubiquinone/menaquinone biosynthesis C-methylase UbiE
MFQLTRKEIDQLVREVYEIARSEKKREIGHLTNKFSIRNYVRMAEEIAGYLKKGRILDWGCGCGHMSLILTRLGFDAVPFDIENALLNNIFSSQKQINAIINLNPINLPFIDKSFDCVLSCGVLEHVPDKEKSLAELHRILKSGGYLFIYMLPNKYSLIEFINSLIGESDHPYKYTFQSIKEMLESNNFTLIHAKRGNVLPKTFRAVPHFDKLFINRLLEHYKFCIGLEKILLNIPILNIFSGTLEIVARKP